MALPAERSRDVLVVLLAVTAGATDATAFDRLGHVFASVITGNLVLLGISAVHADGRLALFAGCALAGYAVGVLLAAPRRGELREPAAIWPLGATVALAADLALLVAFAVFWEIDGRRPARAAEIALLVLCASAMGAQSTAVRRLGEMSTTYLTSTLTGLLEALIARRWVPSHGRSIGILVAAAAGAAAGVALILHARAWLPALQLVPLGIVLVGSVPLVRAGRP
jgi:uncharacterized membrane protein YoaK (UPF0700 family)